MAQNIILNGTVYSIPDTGNQDWGQNLTNLFIAIPQGVLQKTGGAFTLTADTNFGASYGLLSLYYKSRSTNVASAGILRLANGDTIGFRNAANSGNLLIAVNGSDQLTFDGTKVLLSGLIVNADISASAGIVYSKLALTGSIVNADLSASAAIAFSKLASLTSGYVLVGNGSNVPTAVALSGDMTIDNTGIVTIGSNKVTLAQMAQISTSRFLGRTTASTGNVESLTATQATALLNGMVGDSGSGGTKGLVPAPASGDAASAKYLKADGTWAVPAGAGTVTSVGMTVPTILSVSGSPVTTTGTLAVSLATQSAGTVFAGPASGSAATPTFRTISAPTIQAFTSGSGTYTTPTGVKYISYEMISSGGGGSGTSGNGANGGTTTFGPSSCTGGSGGTAGSNAGGAGGTATLGTGAIGTALSGGSGQGGMGFGANAVIGGSGAASPFGGGGGGGAQSGAGYAAPANTGSGGGGSGSTSGANAGSGGGAGGYIKAMITSPAATYSYSVAASASGGTGGAGGGPSGSGYIVVTEYYQ